MIAPKLWREWNFVLGSLRVQEVARLVQMLGFQLIILGVKGHFEGLGRRADARLSIIIEATAKDTDQVGFLAWAGAA